MKKCFVPKHDLLIYLKGLMHNFFISFGVFFKEYLKKNKRFVVQKKGKDTGRVFTGLP